MLDPVFRQFYNVRNPQHTLPSVTTLARHVGPYAESTIQQILRSRLPETKVSIVVDDWTTPYMTHTNWGIMVAFIDRDWRYRWAMLDMKSHNRGKSADILSRLTAKVFEAYQLVPHVHSITADNASNFRTKDIRNVLASNHPMGQIGQIIQI